MSNTLDRLIEDGLCRLITRQMPITGGVQVVPYMQGGDEDNPILPRVVVRAEILETPDLISVNVYEVAVEIITYIDAKQQNSSSKDTRIVSGIDCVVEDSGLSAKLTTSTLAIYGAVTGGREQAIEGNRFVRTRNLTLHGGLR